MSKRNLILLIIVLVIIILTVFGFLYFRPQILGPNSPGTNFISQFNPFGNHPTTTPPVVTPPIDVSGYQPNPDQTPGVKLQLTRISSMPVAGFTVYLKERLKDVPVVVPPVTPPVDNSTAPTTTPVTPAPVVKTTTPAKPTAPATEFMPALRYVDRATGNIYQTFADKIVERKFTGTIIPKVYDAFFGSKGESVVMRYLKTDGQTIETFVGNLPKELLGADTTTINEIKGTLLPNNIKDLSLSPDISNIFYLFTSQNNSTDSIVGTTSNFLTNKKTQIFVSPFTEWLSQWPNARMITLTTKPSSSIPGYMYKMDPADKSLVSVLGNINGLTTLTSPDGKLVLYGNDNLSLYVYHTDTKVSDLLGVRTLPEKCVWNKTSDAVYCAVPKSIDPVSYPDSWYQGSVSFRDEFWKIDIKTGSTTMILDPVTINGVTDVDGIKLALDAGENYLFFVNKKDSFLWELSLK